VGKRTILILAGVIGLFVVYDFWRGYHETRSIVAGIVAIAFGLVGWAYYGGLTWLARYYERKEH
jgi:hypothetical protein